MSNPPLNNPSARYWDDLVVKVAAAMGSSQARVSWAGDPVLAG